MEAACQVAAPELAQRAPAALELPDRAVARAQAAVLEPAAVPEPAAAPEAAEVELDHRAAEPADLHLRRCKA